MVAAPGVDRCPQCGTVTVEQDDAYEINYHGTPLFPQQWRYECACGWTWTTVAQRELNSDALREAKRAHRNRLW